MVIRDIPLERIRPNPKQPRKHFAGLDELARSLKNNGQLTPALVRPAGDMYELVHGERRWRAAQRAGLATLRAEVRDLADAEAYVLALIENVQREDLNPVEEAEALKGMMDLYGYNQAQLAKQLGKSQPWVSGRLALLKLPEKIQGQVITRVITPSAARELSRVESADLQAELADKAAAGNLTVRELEAATDDSKWGWPPPEHPPRADDLQIHGVWNWAEARLAYLDANAGKWSMFQLQNERAAVRLRLERASGRFISQMEKEYGKGLCEWILARASGVCLLAARLLFNHSSATCPQDAPWRITDVDVEALHAEMPQWAPWLERLGWIRDGKPTDRVTDLFGFMDFVLNMFYALELQYGPAWRTPKPAAADP